MIDRLVLESVVLLKRNLGIHPMAYSVGLLLKQSISLPLDVLSEPPILRKETTSFEADDAVNGLSDDDGDRDRL